MGGMHAGVARIVRVVHRATPMIVRMMPAMGIRGMIGQRMMRSKLQMPPSAIMRVPVISKIRREKKPIILETRRSINIWNLRSRDALAEADSADIWR